VGHEFRQHRHRTTLSCFCVSSMVLAGGLNRKCDVHPIFGDDDDDDAAAGGGGGDPQFSIYHVFPGEDETTSDASC